MKVLDLALKDLLRAGRSVFSLAMMLAAPLLITGLLNLAFGGFASGDEIDIALTRVVLVNQDKPAAGSPFNAGSYLEQFLRSEELEPLLDVLPETDVDQAVEAVDSGEAAVAVILPEDFSAAVLGEVPETKIRLHTDPALTFGPTLVEDLLVQFLDGFAGSSIVVETGEAFLELQGRMLDGPAREQLVMDYAAAAQVRGELLQQQRSAGYRITSVVPDQPVLNEGRSIIATTMAGMMIFFMFYSAASAAESIVKEDEEGTLARLFTTPVTAREILGGKFLYMFLLMLVQAALLLASSSLIFGIRWGTPLSTLLAVLATTAASGGFGLFLISFIKSTRQSGVVFGGVMTVSAMLGGLFTTGIPNMPDAWEIVSLGTPHGWVLRCWQLSLSGSSPGEMLGTVLITILVGLVLFSAGTARFQKRFA